MKGRYFNMKCVFLRRPENMKCILLGSLENMKCICFMLFIKVLKSSCPLVRNISLKIMASPLEDLVIASLDFDLCFCMCGNCF